MIKISELKKIISKHFKTNLRKNPISFLKVLAGFSLSLLGIYLKSNAHLYGGKVRNYLVEDLETSYFESMALIYATYVSLDKFINYITNSLYQSAFSEISSSSYVNIISNINHTSTEDRERFSNDILHNDAKLIFGNVDLFFTSSLNMITVGMEMFYFGYIISTTEKSFTNVSLITSLFLGRSALMSWSNKTLKRYKDDLQEKKTLLYMKSREALMRTEIIHSNIAYDWEEDILLKHRKNYVLSNNTLIVKRLFLNGLNQILSFSGMVASLFLAYHMSLSYKDNKLERFQYIFSCLMSIYKSTDQIIDEQRNLLESVYNILRVEDFKEDNQLRAGMIFQANKPPKLEFRHVGLIIKNRIILDDVSFIVNAGNTAAIIGESGSGKSSIAKLILGFYRPTSGSILINDIDIRKFSTQSIRSSFSYLPQKAYILSEGFRHNIAYALTDTNLELIQEASEKAELHEYKSTYERFLHQPLKKLSGGQEQKILLARFFLKQSPLFILDEPTTSIDPLSKNKILRNILKHTKKSTTILITHDQTIAKKADTIISIQKPLHVNLEEKAFSASQYGSGFKKNDSSIRNQDTSKSCYGTVALTALTASIGFFATGGIGGLVVGGISAYPAKCIFNELSSCFRKNI